MKNTIWNGYGIQAVRTGLMNISTAEAVKRFAVYMRRKNSLGFMIIFGKDERVKFEEIRETLSDSRLQAI